MLALDGTPVRWIVNPRMLVPPANGSPQDVLFAVAPQDAQGYTLVNAPTSPVSVKVSGDYTHALSVTAQGNNEFLAHYSGLAVGDISLWASGLGAAPAQAFFAPLTVSPSEVDLAPGDSATISASIAHSQGAIAAVASSPACSVSPASAVPAISGGTVQFTMRSNSTGPCEVTVSSTQFNVPSVLPKKNAVAHVNVGIGPSKIQHVVVLFQENRSFDNVFGGVDNNNAPFPGADTVSNPLPGEPTPHDHNGNPVTMRVGLLEECWDPYHDHPNSVSDVNGGQMNGFDQEGLAKDGGACNNATPAPPDDVYMTLNYSEMKPYWQMGEQYAISDRMYEPFSSGSYGPHLYLVSAQSGMTIDNPSAGAWGCDNTVGGFVQIETAGGGETRGTGLPCFYWATLADEMDQRGVSWRFYAAPKTDFGYDWSSFDSFNDVRNGPEWTTKVITPPSQILTDITNGTLAQMTWVTPTLATSDHPQSGNNMGPAWITSVVDAIGTSKFWDSTAIFVTWDDWGGWYDHVPPPVTGLDTVGIRVGVIVISPYAKTGYVSHVRHTTGSITHFAEEAFNLPSLGQDDAAQDDFGDVFNFSQAPTPFKAFDGKRSQSYFQRLERESGQRQTEHEEHGD